MLVAVKSNEVKSNGVVGDEIDFTIEADAEMFRLLSDNMYKDKIGSLVREITTNAFDAHIDADTPDKPVKIHLPNAIEPWFAVTDQGTGIHPDDIKNVFAAYGKSTKRNTNKMVGAKGLGCKTPFAYADQFTVINRYGGTQYSYTCFYNEKRKPKAHLQDEQPTDQPNGLEVSVAVKTDDFYDFYSAVTTQLRFFPVLPILVNNMRDIEFPDLSQHVHMKIENLNMTLYDGLWESPVKGLWVVQGCVGYPVNVSNLRGISEYTANFAKALAENGAFFRVPIGTIDVTASREDISYEESTIAYITDLLEKASVELCDAAYNEIIREVFLWDRCITYNNQLKIVKKALKTLPNFDVIFKNATEHNYKMSLDIRLNDIGLLGTSIVRQELNGSVHDWSIKRSIVTSLDKKIYSGRIDVEIKGGSTILIPGDDWMIVVKDTKRKPTARIRYHLENNPKTKILFITEMGGYPVEKNLMSISLALGVNRKFIVQLSDMEEPPITYTANKGYTRPTAYIFPNKDYGVYTNSSKAWEKTYDDLDDMEDTVWVEMDRHDFIIDNYTQFQLLLGMRSRDHYDRNIITVSSQTAKRIRAGKIGENLISLEDALVEIKSNVESLAPKFINLLRLSEMIDNITDGNVWGTLARANIQFPMLTRITKMKQIQKQRQTELVKYWSFLLHFNNDDNVDKRVNKAVKKVNRKLKKRYPMLKHFRYSMGKEMIQDVRDYVKLIDSQ